MAPQEEFLVYPKGSSRPPCPTEAPKEYAEDYTESCLVVNDSPKASAALSRRCLQNIIRNVANIKRNTLNDEIDELLSKKILPLHIAKSVDSIRNIGNFAAHPLKSQSTGEIIPVELGEAEWNLDVLESLFDFYFVQPAILKRKRDALKNKTPSGKLPLAHTS